MFCPSLGHVKVVCWACSRQYYRFTDTACIGAAMVYKTVLILPQNVFLWFHVVVKTHVIAQVLVEVVQV